MVVRCTANASGGERWRRPVRTVFVAMQQLLRLWCGGFGGVRLALGAPWLVAGRWQWALYCLASVSKKCFFVRKQLQ